MNSRHIIEKMKLKLKTFIMMRLYIHTFLENVIEEAKLESPMYVLNPGKEDHGIGHHFENIIFVGLFILLLTFISRQLEIKESTATKLTHFIDLTEIQNQIKISIILITILLKYNQIL